MSGELASQAAANLPRGGRWAKLFEAAAVNIADDAAAPARLSGSQSRVLLALLRYGHVRPGNLVATPQAVLARQLRWDRAQVSRAMAGLVAADVLVPLDGVTVGRRGRRYQLNPDVAWVGGEADRYTARKQWRAIVAQRRLAAPPANRDATTLTPENGNMELPLGRDAAAEA